MRKSDVSQLLIGIIVVILSLSYIATIFGIESPFDALSPILLIIIVAIVILTILTTQDKISYEYTDINVEKFKHSIYAILDKNIGNLINKDMVNTLSQSCNIDLADSSKYLKEIIINLINEKKAKKLQDRNSLSLSEKIKLIKKVIDDIEKDEPFYNLPKDISSIFNDIYVELIEDKKFTKTIDNLKSLASIIRTKQGDYETLLIKTKKWQYLAVLIGIIGIALTIITLLTK